MADRGTAKAAAEHHEHLTSREALRLAAIAKGTRPEGRQRKGLNPTDVQRMVDMLRLGKPWPEIKTFFVDVADETIAGWKDEIEKRARESA